MLLGANLIFDKSLGGSSSGPAGEDLVEVEWLIGNISTFIDTGVHGTLDTEIYVDTVAVQDGVAIPLGVGSDGNSPRIACFTRWPCCDFFDSAGIGGRAYFETTPTVGFRYEFYASRHSRRIVKNGALWVSNDTPATTEFTTESTIHLFNSPDQTSVSIGDGSVLIRRAIIKENGVLVRDFVPVSVGGVGYMYDRVSEELFANAGTGAFRVGPEKAAYDAEVEYLLGGEASYIDTGVHGTLDTEFYVNAIAAHTDNAIPLGVGSDGNSPRIMAFMHWQCTDFYDASGAGGRAYNGTRPTVGTRYEFIGNRHKRELYAGGSLWKWQYSEATTEFTTDDTIWLFTSPNQRTVTYGDGSVKICGAYLKQGEELVRCFVPVRVGEVGYMYDIINGNLYENEGTGSFIVGPDI